jgi:hypothetical protein
MLFMAPHEASGVIANTSIHGNGKEWKIESGSIE